MLTLLVCLPTADLIRNTRTDVELAWTAFTFAGLHRMCFPVAHAMQMPLFISVLSVQQGLRSSAFIVQTHFFLDTHMHTQHCPHYFAGSLWRVEIQNMLKPKSRVSKLFLYWDSTAVEKSSIHLLQERGTP